MKTRHQSRAGMALILALFFASVSLVLLGGLATRLISQRQQVDHYILHEECFQGLEAALHASKDSIERGNDGRIGLDGWTQPTPFVKPNFETSGATPLKLTTVPSIEYLASAQNWFTDGIDNNKNGLKDNLDPTELNRYTIHVFARNNGELRQVETVMVGQDVNVWNNAIFAGTGQSGGLVNGNVAIHGGVHLLGDDIPDTSNAIAAIDMSGTSLIHNNYQGLDATTMAMVPALPTTTWNGETLQTLNANLRVKNGYVGMSGNSEIGSPNVSGNTYKETLDGTHVNDGWSGNKSTPTADGRGIPTNVFSDNGYNKLYDLGNRVPFPKLADDWRDTSGNTVTNPSTGKNYTHEEYFTQVLIGDPANPNDGQLNQNITLNVAGNANAAVFWDATTGQYLTGAAAQSAAIPASSHDYIKFDPSANLLRINGQVRINGTLTISGQGNDKTTYYTGKGAILTTGDVTIDTNLLSCNNGNTASTASSFPINNCFGIMSKNNMYVGTTSQLKLLGAFYAEKMIKTTKQTTTMGTFVSNYFDMGSNVPSIYQVPTLATNLPFGMIGNFPIMNLGQISWREILSAS